MGWLPDKASDTFWFLISPITTVPIAVYSASAYVSGQYPYGTPDWKASARNAGIWGAIALGNWAWNAVYHPGKYAYTSAAEGYKVVAHLAANPVTIGVGLATAAAVGWAATGDLHGAVPAGTGMGMPMAPDLYTQGSSGNPAGWDFGSWLEDLL